LARTETPPFVPLTADDVRAAVLVAAGSGLRQGELFGLTADRVDYLRREMRVDRQLWTPPSGRPFLKPPKSLNSYRTVALSSLVVDALAAHVGAFGTGDDGLVFHIAGRPVSRAMASKYIRRACSDAHLEGHAWHDLRHHHASVLLSAGVSPALVAERLGHDVKTLLATYAHVIRNDDDRVRSIVDETLGGSAEDWLRTAAV
jgi:integrase